MFAIIILKMEPGNFFKNRLLVTSVFAFRRASALLNEALAASKILGRQISDE